MARKTDEVKPEYKAETPVYSGALLDILLSLVDALHEQSGDTARLKPIREKIEALKNA